MAIAFSCSECGKQYKVKDELAGRTVTCKDCSSPLRVPAVSPAGVTPEVENLAVEALVESKSEIDALSDQIEFECPRCVETVKVDVKFAGKQAQCPACKYPIRVPQLTDPKARNWRAADHKPTLAKRTDDPNLVGAWGNTTTTSIVSRDALEEADALRTRRIKPSVISKTMWIVIGVLATAADRPRLTCSIRSHRTTKHRDDFMAKAQAQARQRGDDLAGRGGRSPPRRRRVSGQRSAPKLCRRQQAADPGARAIAGRATCAHRIRPSNGCSF